MQSELVPYQTEDGRTRIQCRFEADTVWMTQAQIAENQKYRAFLDSQPKQVDADSEAAVKQLPKPPAKPKRLK